MELMNIIQKYVKVVHWSKGIWVPIWVLDGMPQRNKYSYKLLNVVGLCQYLYTNNIYVCIQLRIVEYIHI